MVELKIAPAFKKSKSQEDPPTVQLEWLLRGWAAGFAWRCRQQPDTENYPDTDPVRKGKLTIGEDGLQRDESEAFLRAYREGLVAVGPDGHVSITDELGGRDQCCLMRRSGCAVALNTQHLMRVGAYAELLLDKGWRSHLLRFAPDRAAFNTYGSATVEYKGFRRDVLFVGAKARIDGSDSLTSLRDDLLAKGRNNTMCIANDDHRKKWDTLVKGTEMGPVIVWLVASGARWTLVAYGHSGRVRIRDLECRLPVFKELAPLLCQLRCQYNNL